MPDSKNAIDENLWLDEALAADLTEHHRALAVGGELLTSEQAERAYRTFRERFGPEVLASLDGEALLKTMHARGNDGGKDGGCQSRCRLLLKATSAAGLRGWSADFVWGLRKTAGAGRHAWSTTSGWVLAPGTLVDAGAVGEDGVLEAVMPLVGRDEANAAVAVLGVVPMDECGDPRAGVVDRLERLVRVFGAVLQRPKQGLDERVVVADLGRLKEGTMPRRCREQRGSPHHAGSAARCTGRIGGVLFASASPVLRNFCRHPCSRCETIPRCFANRSSGKPRRFHVPSKPRASTSDHLSEEVALESAHRGRRPTSRSAWSTLER